MKKTKKENRMKRHRSVRAKIRGTQDRPRLSVYRSNKYIVLQLVNDESGRTIMSTSDRSLKKTKTTKSETAFLLGKKIAEQAFSKNITRIVFDRGGYRYHGRVKKVADGAREGGLSF